MLRPICAILGLLAVTAVASAADMPVKAPPKAKLIYPYAQGGFYLGLGMSGVATAAQINAGGVAGLKSYAAGGMAHAIVGYSFTFGPNRWLAFENLVSYESTGVDLACGTANRLCSFTSRLGAEQRIIYGGDSSIVTQWLPDLFSGFPSIPISADNTMFHPYFGGFVREARVDAVAGIVGKKEWNVTYGPTLGFLTLLKRGALDTSLSMDMPAGSFAIVPGIVADPKTSYRAMTAYKIGFGT